MSYELLSKPSRGPHCALRTLYELGAKKRR